MRRNAIDEKTATRPNGAELRMSNGDCVQDFAQ